MLPYLIAVLAVILLLALATCHARPSERKVLTSARPTIGELDQRLSRAIAAGRAVDEGHELAPLVSDLTSRLVRAQKRLRATTVGATIVDMNTIGVVGETGATATTEETSVELMV